MTTINRGPFNALVDDDGSNTVGTVWNKNQIKIVLLDPIDVCLGALDAAITDAGDGTFTGNVTAGASSAIGWTGRSKLQSTADGNVLLTNQAGSDFGLLRLGGTSNLFPALKRNGAGIDLRLADDSGPAALTAAAINAASLTTTGNATIGGTLGVTGALTAPSFTATGDLMAGAANAIGWTGRSKLISAADGNITISNNAGSDFNLLRLGGITNAFPAIKRNANGLRLRLADDSADASLTANDLTLSSGVLTTPSGTSLQLRAPGSSSVFLNTNGADRWAINLAGTFYPITDNANQFGTSSNRITLMYLSTALLVGASPSSAGAIRLDPASTINWGSTSAFPMLRRNATAIQCVLADGSAYAPCQAGEFSTNTAGGATGAVVCSYLSAGTNPAGAGAIRLANNTGIYARDSANTADILIARVATDGLIYLGTSTRPNTADAYNFGHPAVRWLGGYFNFVDVSQYLVAGTNPATTGGLRMGNNTGTYSRNVGNTADIVVTKITNADLLQLGVTRTAAGTPASFAANTYIRIVDAAGNNCYIPAMAAAW